MGNVAIFHGDRDELIIHASGEDCPSDYDTLCGVDGDDDGIDTSIVSRVSPSKITCGQCYAIWSAARSFKASDFSKEAKK